MPLKMLSSACTVILTQGHVMSSPIQMRLPPRLRNSPPPSSNVWICNTDPLFESAFPFTMSCVNGILGIGLGIS